ncbi:MAG: hypothetical protein IPK68_01075 [Bdellovibrionales bacterium]|nr:hypothetical protein [Bdellovibrionales bacterium]
MVKAELRREVLTIILKVLVGFALTAGFVISVFQLGESLRLHLSLIENQFFLELLTFGVFGLLCAALLILLFRKDLIKRNVVAVANDQSEGSFVLDTLLVSFLEGFLETLDLSSAPQNIPKKERDSENDEKRFST